MTNDKYLESLIRHWRLIVEADPNEIAQLRRVPCRHCHGHATGEGHAYQYTPAEWEKERTEWERKRHARKKGDTDPGEFPVKSGNWYDKRMSTNPDCPECFGEGVEEVFLNDTRNLSPAARALFLGAKQGPNGIEVLLADKECAAMCLELVGAAK